MGMELLHKRARCPFDRHCSKDNVQAMYLYQNTAADSEHRNIYRQELLDDNTRNRGLFGLGRVLLLCVVSRVSRPAL